VTLTHGHTCIFRRTHSHFQYLQKNKEKKSWHHIRKPNSNKGEKISNTLWSLSEISLCRPSRERSATKKPHMPRGVKTSCNCKTCQVKIHTLNSCPRKAISQSFKVRWKVFMKYLSPEQGGMQNQLYVLVMIVSKFGRFSYTQCPQPRFNNPQLSSFRLSMMKTPLLLLKISIASMVTRRELWHM
jgi:hypothetical protein